jgi:capsular exopolysaccharide synthesis family protein
MTDNPSQAPTKKMELEPFSFAELQRSTVESDTDQISIVQFWRVLQKRRWLVLGSLITIALGVAVVSAFLPKRYEATARILLDLEGPDGLALEQTVMPMGIDMNTKLETQIRIVQSDTIATSVIKQLGLQGNETFRGKLADRSQIEFDSLSPAQRVRLVNALHRSLTVQLVPKTQIIEIHFRSKDPTLAADVTNSVANTYIEHNFQTKYKSTLQTADWLTKQLDDLRTKAESAQEQLIAYQKSTGILGTDETHNIIIDKLADLNKQVSQAEADRIFKEAKFRIATTENPELMADIAPESVLGALYKQRSEVRAEYAQMAAKYGAAYPRVVQLQSQSKELDSAITEEITKVGEAVRASYKAALTSEEMLRASFDKQKQEAYKLNEDAIQYAIMRRDVESSRDLYEGLLKKLKEAGIMAGLKSSNVNIVDPASVPLDPVEPKIPLNIALGCLGGLLFGMALAFVVENVDTTIRTPADVENYCLLPSLGVIPRVASNATSGKNGLRTLGAKGPRCFIPPVTMEQRNSGTAEAFRALRTSLLLSNPGTPPQVILVTSAIMQEGKSFTALNLSVVLAQTGQSVLLVDSDMRRPAINKYLGFAMNEGLSACLAGTADPDAVVIKIEEVPGLNIVTAGHMPPYPSEMLASEAMPRLMRHWREQYRFIVVDTPPVLAVTDAVVCSGIADVVVLIARSEQTGRQSLVRARDLLRKVRANIAGVVVNGLSFSSVDYRQYYGHYGSEYQYYYHSPENGNGNGDGNEIH